ncbi:MAG: undecaprenyl-diphosphate phosphatase, partial [Verrucomicrobiota bacterium]
MTHLEAIIVGIVQGLTEFLPVSSSGHLVLSQELMGIDDPGVTFEVLAHVGTLLSVLIYFRKRLFQMTRSLFDAALAADRKLILLLIIGTIPAAVLGIAFKDLFEKAYENPVLVSGLLLVTGSILFLPRLIRTSGERDLDFKSALGTGFGQALAILPGISRSGSTIVTAMLFKVKPAVAAEFSFLLSIPAIGGAAVFQVKDWLEDNKAGLIPADMDYWPYLSGALAAFVFGLLAIYTVLAAVRRGKFEH